MTAALVEDTLAVLRAAHPASPGERFEAVAWQALLRTTGAALLTREHAPAHLTASAAVLTPDGSRTCLVLHRKLRRWVQPGGHLEPGDTSLAAAAAREVFEETGLRGRVLARPAALHRHPAPCAPGVVDFHLDVQHVLVTEPSSPRPSDETPQVAWWPLEALPGDTADGVPDLIVAARAVLLAATTEERDTAGRVMPQQVGSNPA